MFGLNDNGKAQDNMVTPSAPPPVMPAPQDPQTAIADGQVPMPLPDQQYSPPVETPVVDNPIASGAPAPPTEPGVAPMQTYQPEASPIPTPPSAPPVLSSSGDDTVEQDTTINGMTPGSSYANADSPQITSNYQPTSPQPDLPEPEVATAEADTTVPTFDSPTGLPDPVNPPDEDELLDIKKQALQSLAPLVDELDQSPEEKFKTTMMLIQASDNADLVKDAFSAANKITDEKTRAQALLDVVNEINYFTQAPHPSQNDLEEV